MAEASPVRGHGPKDPRAAAGTDTGAARVPSSVTEGGSAVETPRPLEGEAEITLERSRRVTARARPGPRLRDMVLPERGRFAERAALVGLLLTTGGAAGWFARDVTGGPRPTAGRAWDGLARDAISAHRAHGTEIAHPVEVGAKDEAYLAGWLTRRLKRPVVLPDLSDGFGFDLLGGRILPAGPDVAAQLVYADKAGGRLTIYLRTGERGEPNLAYLREGEVSSFAWVDQGTGYVVASAMDRERLQKIARAVSQEFDMEAVRRRRAL